MTVKDNDDMTDEEPLDAAPSEPRPSSDDAPHHEEAKGRLSRLTKILLERGDDAKAVFGTMLDTSDRAKDQMVRMVAREVRNYLEALKLTDDLRDFATSHSLEVKASFHLKPLAKAAPVEEEPAEEPKRGKDDAPPR